MIASTTASDVPVTQPFTQTTRRMNDGWKLLILLQEQRICHLLDSTISLYIAHLLTSISSTYVCCLLIIYRPEEVPLVGAQTVLPTFNLSVVVAGDVTMSTGSSSNNSSARSSTSNSYL